MDKKIISLIVLLILLLAINFMFGTQQMYNMLLLIFIGVVIFRSNDIKKLLT
jgi:hypothetical protein